VKMSSTVRPGPPAQALLLVVLQNSMSICGKPGEEERGQMDCNHGVSRVCRGGVRHLAALATCQLY
jgi:hypothetical protein